MKLTRPMKDAILVLREAARDEHAYVLVRLVVRPRTLAALEARGLARHVPSSNAWRLTASGCREAQDIEALRIEALRKEVQEVLATLQDPAGLCPRCRSDAHPKREPALPRLRVYLSSKCKHCGRRYRYRWTTPYTGLCRRCG